MVRREMRETSSCDVLSAWTTGSRAAATRWYSEQNWLRIEFSLWLFLLAASEIWREAEGWKTSSLFQARIDSSEGC